jgi:hypothetical protein
MINIPPFLQLVAGCAVGIGALWLLSKAVDRIRDRQWQYEITQSDAWERQMQEKKHDF